MDVKAGRSRKAASPNQRAEVASIAGFWLLISRKNLDFAKG
jgi:hypothetical protein